MDVNIKKIHEDAGLIKFNKYDAGFDVMAIEDEIIVFNDVVKIRTGLIISIPLGYEMQIRDRSHIVTETPLRIADSPATIDAGFLDEVLISMCNNGIIDKNSIYIDRMFDIGFLIKKGDRIAQVVFKQVPQITLNYVDDINKGCLYERKKRYGYNGYGSTGLNENNDL